MIVETPGIGQGDAGDRAVRRHLDVRDDAGVRRRLAAGEDRHARLRRRGGDQQVRAPRRQGRAARRGPPAGPQPRGVRQAARGDAGLRHLRGHLQRRRRHRPLPAPARAARRARAAAGRRRAADRRRAPLLRHPPGGADRPGPLPGRDHRDGARLPRADRPAGRGGPPRAAPRDRPGRAGLGGPGHRRRRGAARSPPAGSCRTRSPTRSRAGPRSWSPTPATSRS